MAVNNSSPKKGECECCANTAVILNLRHGSTWQCSECDAREANTLSQAVDANRMVQEVRAVDAAIVLKTDIYNAQTPAVVELVRSVYADASIPQDKKDYVITETAYNHFKHLQQVIFEERQAFIEMMRVKENEMRMWQTQVQTSAAKLKGEIREKYKDFDKSYQPAPAPKSSKSPKPRAAGAADFKKQELFEACKKYSVPMAQVRSIMVQRNIAAEAAARIFAEMMGTLPASN